MSVTHPSTIYWGVTQARPRGCPEEAERSRPVPASFRAHSPAGEMDPRLSFEDAGSPTQPGRAGADALSWVTKRKKNLDKPNMGAGEGGAAGGGTAGRDLDVARTVRSPPARPRAGRRSRNQGGGQATPKGRGGEGWRQGRLEDGTGRWPGNWLRQGREQPWGPSGPLRRAALWGWRAGASSSCGS